MEKKAKAEAKRARRKEQKNAEPNQAEPIESQIETTAGEPESPAEL